MNSGLNQKKHNQSIVDQFTRQAIPFSQKSQMSSDAAFKLMIDMCEVNAADTVLDVACGPGMTACEFAKVAAQVTGIDLTPAMIKRAEARQADQAVTNLTWQIGDVSSLPYDDGSFSLVVTRFSFHHFLDPRVVLAEMTRVCAPGGRVMVWDSIPEASKADAYNQVEKLKDPSHARAMPAEELLALVAEAGLMNIRTAPFKLEFGLEKQLASMFPDPGDVETIRQIYLDDLITDSLGMGVHKRGEEIYFHYPTMIIVGTKPDQYRER
jgi:ubiquinone/menaquinone biosynthesis C-methylase UbiE